MKNDCLVSAGFEIAIILVNPHSESPFFKNINKFFVSYMLQFNHNSKHSLSYNIVYVISESCDIELQNAILCFKIRSVVELFSGIYLKTNTNTVRELVIYKTMELCGLSTQSSHECVTIMWVGLGLQFLDRVLHIFKNISLVFDFN